MLGEFIVSVPYVRQVKLSLAGGRLVIASDGVWDALTPEMALESCHGMPADVSASQIVKQALEVKGLRDDTSCIVIDIQPPEKQNIPLPPIKKQSKGVFQSMFFKRSSQSSSHLEHSEPYTVEELFEDGSALLTERLDSNYPLCNTFKLFKCAICQVQIKRGEGVSIHARLLNSRKLTYWDGPFLCPSCQKKNEAMEGKRHGDI